MNKEILKQINNKNYTRLKNQEHSVEHRLIVEKSIGRKLTKMEIKETIE